MLKPDKFEDLITNDYTTGSMGYIPEFVDRKHGKSKVEYDLPEMEEYLKDTYVLQSIKTVNACLKN